jgi:chloramphenicol-sensitive protein RarD
MTGEPAAIDAEERRKGAAAAIGAYGVWALIPLLFRQVDAVSPLMVIIHRILWSFVLVGAVLLHTRRFYEVRAALRIPAVRRSMVVSAVLLTTNWLIFVWAVHNDKVLEISFGYYVNPLVSVAIGMVLLHEKLSKGHTVALLIALVAVGIMTTGISGLPLVSLGLAFSFGFYGYFRKTAAVGSVPGLFVETAVLLPLALAYLCYSVVAEGPGPLTDSRLMFWLVFAGPATAIPLILFAYGSKRMKLATIGMIQYIAPSGQFLLAVFAFGEPLNIVQLVSFALIWVSLMVFSADSLMHRPRETMPPAAE